MELFKAAGIDLPMTDGLKAKRGRALTRAIHVSLFNYKVITDERSRGTNLFDPTPGQMAAAADYARKIRDPRFLDQKETAVREILVQDIVQTVLGYRSFDPGHSYTLAREWSIRSGAVDVALGRFNAGEAADELIAPFELKGPDTSDLDRIMPGRGRSPVQQAWDYAIDAPGSRWVLVSNCLEIRLYGFGRGRDAYELFDLRRLDERDEHHRLWLILAEANLLGGVTDRLLSQSDSAYRDVTNQLYDDYKSLRQRLIGFLANGADRPRLSELQAIESAQKLLDRVLFIAFAQRTDLMADRLLERAAKERSSFTPQPLWQNFLGLFRAVDTGNSALDIPPYNGGLFAHDPIIDGIILPDHLAEDIARLGQWDYRRQVPVTVLGHLFEQSITDIEALKAGAAPKVSKRKREGVVYTPDVITRFLVERTVGLALEERREAMWRRHGMEGAPTPEQQIAFWRTYLKTLLDFTIVDPACGSGAFLVAAFDEMARRYRDAVTALEALEVEIDFDVFDQIVTRNLYGVDLNAESVEITRLSLWLKTARRDHRLQNLESTIKDGNSLIADPAVAANPFDWPASYPDVFERGGFDVVIGNPPYVRMEHLKTIKPYLSAHYVVADDRTDLCAYFFERGIQILKTGGRLGYIASSTFFKTGSGENLRILLADGVAVESVVDFGDVQLFDGVTTYPAILTLKKGVADDDGDLAFLTVEDKVPDDLERAFARGGQTMPRARLGKGSWRFEGDGLAALRAKIAVGRETLGEVYGAPMRGIVTGLNEAFVIDRATRDTLVKADPGSAELLKPFLRGENIRRWRVESENLFLINTPKGKVNIDDYPAIRNWLSRFRQQLEARATQQEWWELQQAQLVYQEAFSKPKIVYQDITAKNPFALDEDGYFLGNTVYFIPTRDAGLLALLNSRLSWSFFSSTTNIARGGYLRLRTEFVQKLPIPTLSGFASELLGSLAVDCTKIARSRLVIQSAVRHRMLDLAPSERRKLSRRLRAWWEIDFPTFRAEIQKTFRTDIPLKERAKWEAYLEENGDVVRKFDEQIIAAEQEINRVVYDLYNLTSEEIRLIEGSLVGIL